MAPPARQPRQRREALGPGVSILSGARAVLERVDLLICDVDGVLVDASLSYPAAVAGAVEWFCRDRLGLAAPPPVAQGDLPAWKAAGGFNDDWRLAQAACLYAADRWRRGRPDRARAEMPGFVSALAARGGGLDGAAALCPGADAPPWDPAEIARVCMELYGGDDGCAAMFGFSPGAPRGPGLWRRERALAGRAALLPWRGRLALYTGRNAGEAAFALAASGLEDLFPPAARHTADLGYAKPDPRGLALAVCAARPAPRAALFAGDAPDDQEAVRRYRAAHPDLPPILFAGVLGGAPGPAAAAIFTAGGADLIAGATADLLAALPPPGPA